MNYKTAPVIIIGMHRSGTSMVADMLRRCGLFLGVNREHNCENRLFIRLNQWLLNQCSARWDNPEAIDLLLADGPLRKVTAEYLESFLSGLPGVGYCGVKKFLCGKTLSKNSAPWGWKDPRTTFTLPLWLDIFPDARVIHVLRHGVDTAESILRRTPKQFVQSQEKFRRFRKIAWLRPKSGGFKDTLRITNHHQGVKLWHSYACRAQENLKLCKNRSMEIQYEEFLARPAEKLAELVDFCQLDSSAAQITEIASEANPQRRYSFAENAELRQIAESNCQLLKEFGYTPAGEMPDLGGDNINGAENVK